MNFYEAHQAAKAAQANLVGSAQRLLKDTLESVFENSEVLNIAWAQRYSEYDDEGLYPGICGPIVNAFDEDEIVNLHRTDIWDKLPMYGNSVSTIGFDREVRIMKNTLDAIGAETLCAFVGGDENMVVVTREGVNCAHVGY